MSASINEPEKYRPLIDAIKAHECVVFVGAGLSAKAGYPTWPQLMKDAIGEVKLRSSSDEIETLNKWLKQGEFMNIASFVHKKMEDDRYAYNAFLKKTFAPDKYKPTTDHNIIVELPFRCIITSNYDKLIESAYQNAHGFNPIVKTYASSDIGSLNFEKNFYVFKCHGTIDEPASIIWTNQQYEKLIYENQAYREFFKTLIGTRILLFMGYSMRDPDLIMMRGFLNTIFAGQLPRSYILLTGFNDTEIDTLERNAHVDVITFDNPNDDFRKVTEFLQILQKETGIEPPKPLRREGPRLERIPFKFLDCYYGHERQWFHGRDNDPAVGEILKRMRGEENKILQIIGISGAGKSSAIQAIIIPELETKDKYICNYVNCPISLKDLNIESILTSQQGPDSKRRVLFIDHFEKILDEYEKHEESRSGIQAWANDLVKSIGNMWKVVFINTKNVSSMYFIFLFQRACQDGHEQYYKTNEPVTIAPLTREQFITSISKAMLDVKEEQAQEWRFEVNLLNALAYEYAKLREKEYALTYIQAVCYYLVKMGYYEDPEGLKNLPIADKLKALIFDYGVGEIVNSLCQREDRIILIEVVKKIFEESRFDFSQTMNKDADWSVKKLLAFKTEFPERIGS